MSEQVQDFAFTDGGNEFVCTVERSHVPGRPVWWWFSVASDTRGQRYAPFHTQPDDTKENVKQRILEYYDRLLVSRATPATSHWQQRRANRPAAVPPAVSLAAEAQRNSTQ